MADNNKSTNLGFGGGLCFRENPHYLRVWFLSVYVLLIDFCKYILNKN